MLFQPHWYVLKTCNNVTFKRFDGLELAVGTIAAAIPAIKKHASAYTALKAQLDPTISDQIGPAVLT